MITSHPVAEESNKKEGEEWFKAKAVSPYLQISSTSKPLHLHRAAKMTLTPSILVMMMMTKEMMMMKTNLTISISFKSMLVAQQMWHPRI